MDPRTLHVTHGDGVGQHLHRCYGWGMEKRQLHQHGTSPVPRFFFGKIYSMRAHLLITLGLGFGFFNGMDDGDSIA